ncbi:hypothetical protein FTO74_06235 [Granulicella sp. WH15]|uniref:hypothetical protein n=1 Tax=Granulicella sp. WH15 TaxID=2602070 RepID=UPI0013677AF8|nr:hypothetical protein [Granulicella sp. WH15]QHN03013.1 hypothetical protein FTO74_06235 [Granulicella sp. WH15]
MKIRTALLFLSLATPALAAPHLRLAANPTPRERFAAERLRTALKSLPGNEQILMATRMDPLLAPYDKQIPAFWPDAKEAFLLRRIGNTIIVTGFDASGVLYGAEELIDRINAAHTLPSELDFEDHPQLKLRGAVIGMQKPELTYENAEYDYRYTPEEFPWFYDKAAWTKYLDQLAAQRVNSLFIWNGHPFTSLLKLPKYPEAQELPTAQLDANIAMFKWLTAEADKRGIWVLQGFYNIHLSHTFAKAHHLPFHLSAPSDISREYTRYCISEFIREYPNVGIFMTLGEAMGPHYGKEWITSAIIPGVLDGLAEQEKAVGHPVPPPPIVVRAHATDIEDVMPAAKAMYPNLDTMWKWNGESFTWTNIRGPVKQRFEKLVAGSNTTVVNMHLMSNFEPFRWGNPDFIRQTTLSFVRLGIGGVHVYPLRYWDWPNAADKTDPLLNQTDRDWIWYESWARYGWNPERDPRAEHSYWAERFAERFTDSPESHVVADLPAMGGGTLATQNHFTGSEPTRLTVQQLATGEHLLSAYELSGICAAKLLPRIGITEGNRQVLSLGMTMPQLIDAARYNPAETLWTGDAPDGERLDEYVANEVNHKPHHGETPVAIAAMAAESSAKAVIEAEAAAPGISAAAKPEYERVVNDMRAIAALMSFYNHKTQAAVLVMKFGYDHDPSELQKARTLLAASVDDFAKLKDLTDTTYRNAAGMQTSQRQIPVRGGPTTNHWRDLLPVYQKELATFDVRLKSLTNPSSAAATEAPKQLPQVGFTLASGAGEIFNIAPGAKLYTDAPTPIATVAPELNGLTGIRVSTRQEVPIHFTLDKPAQILVGFFKSDSRKAMNVSPATEQWNILLPNAVTVTKGLPITVWTKPLPAGENDLDLGKGAYVVLGFIPEETHVTPHINFSTASSDGHPPNLDWLFEN